MIRFATKDDIPELLSMLEQFHKESSYGHLEFSRVKTAKSIAQFMESSKEEQILLVCEQDGNLTALIAGMIIPHIFTDESTAHELVFYVTEEGRKSRGWLELLKAYTDWAFRLGVKHATLGSVEDKYSKFLGKHLGYTPIEESLMVRLN